jgi:hypothetical protein
MFPHLPTAVFITLFRGFLAVGTIPQVLLNAFLIPLV